MNNRQRMRTTNKMVRNWLLKEGYDEIWFKPHTKRNDWVFTQKGNYMATDLWNLFDGMAYDKFGNLIFLQMKTNAWAKEKDIVKFTKNHNHSLVLIFNVTNKLASCKGHYKLFTRMYNGEGKLDI